MKLFSILLGAIVLYILQNILYRKFWNDNLEIALGLSAVNAYEGDDRTLTLTIMNRKLLPLPALKVKFMTSSSLLFEDEQNSQITDHYYRSDLLSVMMYQKLERTLQFRCSKRGYYTFSDLTSVCSNLFLTSELVSSFPCNLNLYVYPGDVDTERFQPVFRKMFGTVLTKRFINEDPFEFRAIREYQNFDAMNSVNWKASAKTGELMVNTHDFTSSHQVHIYLNLESSTLLKHDDLLEEGIRLASSFAASFLENGIPVSITTNGVDLVSRNTTSLPEGSGNNHIQSIRELLSRIDLKATVPSFLSACSSELLHTSDQEFCLLISTYQRRDLQDIMLHLAATRKDFIWVVPYHEEVPIELCSELTKFMLPWSL